MGFLSFLGFGRKKTLVDRRLNSLDTKYLDLHRQMRELEDHGHPARSRAIGGARRPVRRSVRPGAPPSKAKERVEPRLAKGRRGAGQGDRARREPTRGGRRMPANFELPPEGGPHTVDAQVAIKAIVPPVDLECDLRRRRSQAIRFCFIAILLTFLALFLWLGDWSSV